MGDAFPLSAHTQIYASTGESNFGKIGSPEIDAKIEQTLQELDPAKARKLANEVDKLIWAEGFSLPLIQSPGNVGVNSSLANFGAAGWPTWTTPQSASCADVVKSPPALESMVLDHNLALMRFHEVGLSKRSGLAHAGTRNACRSSSHRCYRDWFSIAFERRTVATRPALRHR